MQQMLTADVQVRVLPRGALWEPGYRWWEGDPSLRSGWEVREHTGELDGKFHSRGDGNVERASVTRERTGG